MVAVTCQQHLSRVENGLGIGETASREQPIPTEVSMRACERLTSLVPEPDCLTHGSGGQARVRARWAAGLDIFYDLTPSDAFENPSVVKL
jgi:hypothetical protein